MQNAETTVADGLLTIAQAAQHMSRSRSTIEKLLREGEVPYVRVGADRLIPRRELNRYLAARLVRPNGDAS